MSKFQKSMKLLPIVGLFIVMTLLWQNCGGIKLSHIAQNSVQCIPSLFQIVQDTPQATTTHFKINDPDGLLVHQPFSWSLMNADETPVAPTQTANAEDFTVNTSQLVACTVYHVHAKYTDCNGDSDLMFPYRPGNNCDDVPPPPPPPGDPGCPASLPTDPTITQALTGNVNWGRITGNPPPPFAMGFPLVDWDQILGRIERGGPVIPWPGVGGSQAGIHIRKNQYIGLKFHVPANTALTLSGMLVHPSYPSAVPGIAASFSTTCGNFTPAQPACLNTNARPTDDPIFHWTTDPTNTNPYICTLIPGQDYYLNLKFVNPQDVNSTWCRDTNCTMVIWSIYGN
jgi:hypothetical protein